MFWAETGCSWIPSESLHVIYSIYATASTSPAFFRV